MNATDHSAHLATLLAKERGSLADFLVSLAEFDAKRLWLDLGYPTLWLYLTRELGFSDGAAGYRKAGCDLVQKFPEIVEPLRDGRLCFSTVYEVAKVLTRDNVQEVLPQFFHRSKRQAQEIVAEIRPVEAPPKRTVVTAVARQARQETRALPVADATPSQRPLPVEPDGTESQPIAPPRDEVVPLSAELRRIHMNASKRFMEKVDAARDALSHSNPKASLEEILEVGLDLILERRDRRKGLVRRPRKDPRPCRADAIPAAVKRAVWIRDGGRCAALLPDGSVCGSTFQLEYDHLEEVALGGVATVETTRLACRPHNQRSARLTFGNAWMDRSTRKGRTSGNG